MKGKYANASIFATHIDSSALDEIKSMLNDELLKGCHVAIMPDVCYAGTHSVVGYVQTTIDKFDPRTVSGDIGCGITLYKTNMKIDNLNLSDIDCMIKDRIKSTFNENFNLTLSNVEKLLQQYDLKKRLQLIGMSENTFLIQLYTIGNGNHYILLGKDNNDNLTIAVHSGSRNFGGIVLKYFMKLIKTEKINKDLLKVKINEIKKQYKGVEISDKINELTKYMTIKRNENYLSLAEDISLYKEYMELAQNYACLNRKLICDEIVNMLGANVISKIDTMHNYIDKSGIIRKGAISAYEHETIIIALNMAEGMIVAKGKGNEEWLYSAPHGLGRMFSRSKGKEILSMDDFKDDMKNVYSTSINESTIDESPKAYKPLDAVLPLISDTCEIIETIKPILNIKF